MRTYTFHEVIDQIASAKPYAKTDFCLTTLPTLESLLPFLRGDMRKKLRAPLVLYQHLLLVLSLYGACKKHDLVLVRDFLTLPLICFIGLALPLRTKICLMNVQNLQRAHTSTIHRVAFILLCKMKFGMACPEGLDGLQELGLSATPDHFFYIPHPVVPVQRREVPTAGKKMCVGIVGVYRPEKGMSKLIPSLIAIQKKSGVDVMIGTPDYAALKSHLGSTESKIEIRDTTSGQDFAAALLRCDVVLFNYSRGDYYYRGSGVITNAVECGANVVCPDFPIFRKQVLSPVPIGGLFADESGIVETTLTVLAEREHYYANISVYASSRDFQAIAKLIDDFYAARTEGRFRMGRDKRGAVSSASDSR